MKIGKVVRIVLMTVGVCSLALVVWLMAGGPIVVDRWLSRNETPIPAKAIVCIGGGFSGHNLPLEEGWQRIYTAVQLHYGKFAPVVVFSGGGASRVTEAEIYSEAAVFLGLPQSAVVLDPVPGGTNEHPSNLLKVQGLGLTKDSPLLIVTSSLHATRTALCFRKAGFTNFRMVSSYVARGADASIVRDTRRSSFKTFQPNGKSYDDPINRLKWGLDGLLTCLREVAAIGAYKARGYI